MLAVGAGQRAETFVCRGQLGRRAGVERGLRLLLDERGRALDDLGALGGERERVLEVLAAGADQRDVGVPGRLRHRQPGAQNTELVQEPRVLVCQRPASAVCLVARADAVASRRVC